MSRLSERRLVRRWRKVGKVLVGVREELRDALAEIDELREAGKVDETVLDIARHLGLHVLACVPPSGGGVTMSRRDGTFIDPNSDEYRETLQNLDEALRNLQPEDRARLLTGDWPDDGEETTDDAGTCVTPRTADGRFSGPPACEPVGDSDAPDHHHED